jgi:hypothetical protein
MVQGTDFPAEYVVYLAHLDGPNNGNPQTDETRGITSTSNAYDNGLAVAVGLAISKELAANPPPRSVLFLFDDGEEGWDHVPIPAIGQTEADLCLEIRDTEWYLNLFDLTGGIQDAFDIENCLGGLLGASYWYVNRRLRCRMTCQMTARHMI